MRTTTLETPVKLILTLEEMAYSLAYSKDPRILELLNLIEKADNAQPIKLHLYESGNIYWHERVMIRPSTQRIKGYFGEKIDWPPGKTKIHPYGIVSPVCNAELAQMLEDSSAAKVQYVRKFDDGVVQVAGLGFEWASKPGTCLAVYGHIISEREK